MKRKLTRKTEKCERKKHPEDLLISIETSDYNFYGFSSESIKDLHLEISEALRKIFWIFLQDFQLRKQERLRAPELSQGVDKKVIETVYRNELTQKIKQLVHIESFQQIYYIFYDNLRSFLRQLYAEISTVEASAQVLILSDALCTVENAGEELSKITQGLFEQRPSVSCEYVVKYAFYEKVVLPFEPFEFSNHPHALSRLKKLKRELSPETTYLDAQQSEDDIDAIVDYIEGRTRRNRKKNRLSKASTADPSLSPLRRSLDDSVDREVKLFKRKLKQNKTVRRLKPRITDDWINRIRKLIDLKHLE